MNMSQAEFDRLSDELFNNRVGDFLYIHHEANPSWYHYFDIHGNQVQHGGRGDSTDVIVKIKKEHRETLEPRLYAYMRELLARHGEELHREGRKLFAGLTIELPYKLMNDSDLRVTLHTGSGCFYDQDEIAYEVMAALSGVPTLKALAPTGSYYGFIRKDKVRDECSLRFEHNKIPLSVTFGHGREMQPIVFLLESADQAAIERFKGVMFAELASYVKAKAEVEFSCAPGVTKYTNAKTNVVTEVVVSFGDVILFSVSSPYSDWVPFNRLDCAKHIMNALHENLVRNLVAEEV